MTDSVQRGAAADIGPKIEALIAEGQMVTLRVSGDSMRPLLKPGRDAAVLAPLTDWPPAKYDILFYRSERSPSGYSLHRAIRVDGDTLTMNGDAQGWTEKVRREAVLARAVMLKRAGEPFDIEGKKYRAFVRAWPLTRPFRKPMFALWRGIKKIIGK